MLLLLLLLAAAGNAAAAPAAFAPFAPASRNRLRARRSAADADPSDAAPPPFPAVHGALAGAPGLYGTGDTRTLATASIAHLGDAVLELAARRLCLWPAKKAHDQHLATCHLVRAETQAEMLFALMADDAPFALTDDERDWGARGRNAAGRRSDDAYRWATALETLVGFVALEAEPARLDALLEALYAGRGRS